MKISYANMKLKVKTEINTFDFCGNKIEVLKYLPAQDKYNLLESVLSKSLEDNFYNEFKLNLYFELYLVYMYTNISFTEKQKEDEFKLYDTLKSNGFFELFYNALEDTEYDDLIKQMIDIRNSVEKSMLSAASIFSTLVEDLPKNAAAAAEIVNSFNPQSYKEVIDFARYANGSRDINTNEPVDTPVPKVIQDEK